MKNPISSRDMDKLFEKSMKEDMPEIWWCLRMGIWPDAFGEERIYAPDQAAAIIEQIPRIVGRKACYRHAATHHGDMNDQMFDDWWDSAESAPYKTDNPSDPFPKWIGEDRTQRCKCGNFQLLLVVLLAQLLLLLIQVAFFFQVF